MTGPRIASAVLGLLIAVGLTALVVYATQHGQAASTSQSSSKTLYHCGMHPQVVQDHPGTCPICHMALTPLNGTTAAATAPTGPKKVLYWWDPMLGPSSIANHPGKSAMGMDMVPVYA